MRRLVLGVLGGAVACVIIALIVLNVCAPLATPAPSNDGLKGYLVSLKDEVRNHVSVTLEVYKNGELVRKKVGDPISDQWLKLVADFLLGYGYYGDMVWKYEDGDQSSTPEHYYFGTENKEGNPKPKLAIGTGSSAYPPDYALSNKVMEMVLDSNYIDVSDTGSLFNVVYNYTFIADATYNVSEVGLFLQVDKCYKVSNKWILIAHDTFEPVNLQPNDAITVSYKFSIDYSSPPFLKTFWELLLDYFMGLRGAGCPVGSTQVDLGYIGQYTYCGTSLRFAYVLSDVAWSPIISISYDISDVWYLRRINSLACGDQEINMSLIAIQGNSLSTYTAYGIMLYLRADTDIDGGISINDIPIAYIRFDQPVNVDSTKYFIVDLVIRFNQG